MPMGNHQQAQLPLHSHHWPPLASPQLRPQAGAVRRRPPVDPQDAEALRRRVKALQKKLREIEKLKAVGSWLQGWLQGAAWGSWVVEVGGSGDDWQL